MKPFILSSLILASSCLLSAKAIASDSIECKLLETKTKVAPADYVPGVDAEGNKVVPADVGESKPAVNDVLKFPLTLDLANRVQQLQDLGITAESVLGVVEIHDGGMVKYNDQDITTTMKTLCGHALKEEPVAEIPKEEPVKAMETEAVGDAKQAVEVPVEATKAETENSLEEQVEAVSKKVEEVSQDMVKPEHVEELDRVVKENTAMPPPPPQPDEMQIKHETEVIEGGAYREYYE